MSLSPELEALDRELGEQFDREAAEIEKEPADNPDDRDITVFPGFSGMGVMPREIDGLPYEDSLGGDTPEG